MSNEELILAKLNSMEKAINSNAVRSQRMERALLGDKEFEQKGLITRVGEVETHISKEKISKAKQTGLLIGLSAAGGGLGAWIKSLFS